MDSNWVSIVIASIAPLFVFIEFLISRKDDKERKKDRRITELQEKNEKQEETIETLKEAILQLTKNDTEQNQYMRYIGDELMGLAHDKLVVLTDHYQLRGCITLKEKATLEAIFFFFH